MMKSSRGVLHNLKTGNGGILIRARKGDEALGKEPYLVLLYIVASEVLSSVGRDVIKTAMLPLCVVLRSAMSCIYPQGTTIVTVM
jgi:hypothetical protein